MRTLVMDKLFVAVYWFWIISEFLLQVFMRTRRRSGAIRDRGSLLLLLPVIFGSMTAGFWYKAAHPADIPGDPHTIRAVALSLILAGLAIRWAAILMLGRAFSTNVAIRKTQRLKTDGLYRWVRHPSYTGMVFTFVGLGLDMRRWVSLAVVLLFPMVALLYRIHVEERALTEAFGSEYAEYSRRTRRLIPGVY